MGTRILVALLLIALLFVVLFFGGIVEGIIFTALAILCVHEMRKLFASAKQDVFIVPAYVFAAVYWVVQEFLGIGLLAAVWFCCMMAVMIERVCNPQRTSQGAMAGFSVLIWPLACLTMLMLLGELPDRAMALSGILLAFAAPLLGDTFAYFIGVFFGKHKLCPKISEKKTVEGACAYVVGAVAGGVALYFAQQIWQGTAPLLPILILAFLCGFVGQFGDLFASTWKRWAGIKDFGTLLPGHGGALDRIDSVLLCTPFIFFYFYWFAGMLG